MPSESQPTLHAEMRDVAHARILRGAMQVLAEQGFEATVDDVAVAAGVSRRTVFRHFATHGELLAEGITAIIATYDALMAELEPPGADPGAWLEQTALAVHELNRTVLGRAFWDIHVDRPGTPPEVRAAVAEARRLRVNHARRLAATAWPAWGGAGPPPRCILDAFNLQLSPFATNAMVTYPPRRAAEASATVLRYVLDGCLVDHPDGGEEDGPAAGAGR